VIVGSRPAPSLYAVSRSPFAAWVMASPP